MADHEFFDLDTTRDRSRLRDADAASRIGGLEALVGPRRTTRVADGPRRDLPQLIAMVDAATADRVPMDATAMPSATRRPPRRIDWLTAFAGAAAVMAVAVASTFTAVQIANASPVGDAAVLLQSDAESLTSAELGLEASRARVDAQVQADVSTAEAFQATLAGLAPDEDEFPFFEAAVVDAGNAAAAQHIASLQAIELPARLPEWTPPVVDDESLASVSAAIDDVQARAVLVDEQVGALRTVRQQVETAAAEFTVAVDTFRGSVGAAAQAVLDDAPAAQQELRDALAVAAAAVGGADLTTEAGAATLLAYRDAVRAVRADQSAAENVGRRPNSNSNSNSNRGQQQQPPTAPPTDEPVVENPPTNPGDTGDPGGDGGTDPTVP